MSLENLRTDYVDVYYLHNFRFGDNDEYLEAAIHQMRAFKEKGFVRFLGMRGPHRFTQDRELSERPAEDKYARFLTVADLLQPDLVQLRFNMLTPRAKRAPVFDWAHQNNVGLVINKPLAQGLLLDKYDPDRMPDFGPGDHRRRKRWFTSAGVRVIRERLQVLKQRFGGQTQELVRLAIQYCISQSPQCCVVVGFKNPRQVEMSLSARNQPLTSTEVQFIETTFRGVEEKLGHYFKDGWS